MFYWVETLHKFNNLQKGCSWMYVKAERWIDKHFSVRYFLKILEIWDQSSPPPQKKQGSNCIFYLPAPLWFFTRRELPCALSG